MSPNLAMKLRKCDCRTSGSTPFAFMAISSLSARSISFMRCMSPGDILLTIFSMSLKNVCVMAWRSSFSSFRYFFCASGFRNS